jgi:EmrB/QacA subfamily drug resistance transporter
MRTWSPLIAVCLGTFMLLVDVTIVTVALPVLTRDLHSSLSDLQWVLDGYALALAALLLGLGSVADRLGRKAVYLVGLVVFALASLACGVAPNAGTLIAARFVQGAGAAAMLATTIALLNIAYQGRERAIAFGVWGAVNGAAAAAGPILGGLLTQHVDWRWIFLVNLPVSVVAIALTVRSVTESRSPHGGRLDLLGTATFTIAVGAVVYALIRANDTGWTAPSTLALFGLGAAAAGAFVAVERRVAQPMLDLRLFRSSTFTGVMVAGLLGQAAAFAYLIFTSVWLQTALHKGPVLAGVLGSLPLAAAGFVVAVVAGRFLHGVSGRWTIGIGMLLIGLGDLWQSTVDDRSTGLALLPGLIVAGIGVGASSPALASTALAAVPRERSGMASGAINTFRQVGYAVGVAAYGAVFQSRTDEATAVRDTLLAAGVTGLLAGVAALALLRRTSSPAAAPAVADKVSV